MKQLLCAAAAAVGLCGGAMAAPIVFTFTSTGADIVGGPAVGVDLVISLTGDTANYLPAPSNAFGGARYAGLAGTISSVALGLSGATLSNPLDVVIGAPVAGQPEFLALSDGVAFVGLTRAGSSVGDFVATWDGISNFAVTSLQTLTNNTVLNLNVAGSPTIGLIRIDGDGGPGPQDGGFSATLVTNNGTVPEPMTAALVLAALAAGSFATRRRSA